MFSVLDPDINFSDHLPLHCNIQYAVPTDQPRVIKYEMPRQLDARPGIFDGIKQTLCFIITIQIYA